MLITCGGQVLEVRAEDKRTNQEVQRLIAEDRQKALASKEVLIQISMARDQPYHHDSTVESGQWVVNKKLSVLIPQGS